MSTLKTLKKFDELYDSTYNDILKYVICNCSNIEDAKDIVQNIYFEVYKKISKIDINKSYIIGIAKHKVSDFYRLKYKSDKIIEFDNLESLSDDIRIEDKLITNANIENIWLFLKTKNIIISKIFYLYYYCDLSLKDVANELNITESNVKNYLYRTLKELNLYIVKECDEND